MNQISATLILTEIPFHWTELTIQHIFHRYGTISSIQFINSIYPMEMRYVLVTFQFVAEAYTALIDKNLTTYDRIILRISWAFPAYYSIPGHITQDIPQLIVSFKRTTAVPVSDEVMTNKIKAWLSVCGIVTMVSLQRHSRDERCFPYGFAFVTYDHTWIGMTSAINAVNYFSYIEEIDGYKVDAKFGKEFYAFLQQLGMPIAAQQPN